MSDNTEGRPRRDRSRRRRGGSGRSGSPKNESVDNREQPPKREAQGRRDGQSRRETRRDAKGRQETSGRRDTRGRDGSGTRPGAAVRPDAIAAKDFTRPLPSRRERRFEPEAAPAPVLPSVVCPRCGEPIQDITSALSDRESGTPIHFDCAVKFLEGAEGVKDTQKIVYIGQGRFAVMEFETPGDTKKFHILRTIEWESREHRAEWRAEIASQFSQVR